MKIPREGYTEVSLSLSNSEGTLTIEHLMIHHLYF